MLKYARCPLLHSAVEGVVKSKMYLIGPTCRATLRLKELLRGGKLTNRNARGGRFPCHFCIDSLTSRFGTFTGSVLPCSIRVAGGVSVRGCWGRRVTR